MESKFIALVAVSKAVEWLRNLLLDIELWPKPMPAISLHCDSQATMSRAISWASKKQTCITHSTMESKFIELVVVSKEVEWLRNLLLDIEL